MAKKKIAEKEEKFVIFPLLALEHIVLSPMIPQPVRIDSEEQREFIDKCYTNNSEIFFATTNNPSSDLNEKNIKKTGLVCVIDRVLQMPGAPSLVFVRPISRAEFCGIVYSPSYPMAKVSILKDIEPPKRKTQKLKLLMERVDTLFKNLIQFVPEPEKINAEKLVSENSKSPVQHIYAISHVSPITWEDKYKIIETDTFNDLIELIAIILDENEQKINLQAQIHERTHRELSQQQKEAFLRVHLKQIKAELGEFEDSDDISELYEKASSKKWDENTKKHFDKEIQKLRRLNINNPEYSVQYAYLNNFLELPWNNYNDQNISLDKVEKILDRDHFGLEKVKERILEYMAVLKLRNDLKAPILCLYGPPGVGKTSIGRSVAEAVGREYSRISLGGIHDEAEIRGHRRTYIGAMPGRFLHSLSKLKYGNPLILLDEIDKVGKDYKGDPSSALLEALDPEQNNTFHDNFIDYPYDLSKVLFIATANELSSIPMPLRDRMEIIEMPGYNAEEKREIALRHLVTKALSDNGFRKDEIVFSPSAIDAIVKSFTREAGVRQLDKNISKIIRKIALLKVREQEYPREITETHVYQFLNNKDNRHHHLGFH